jgi:putative SOS response-associated peptidase YedK
MDCSALDYSETRIKLKFDADCPPGIPASWNVCRWIDAGGRSQSGRQRIPQQMRWGLVPWWAKDIKVGFFDQRRAGPSSTTRRSDAWKDGQRA